MAHHRLLYKHIHKQHHQFKVPIGIAYDYASPLEDVFVNSLPMLLVLLVFRLHLAHWMAFMALRLWETIDAHSGYDLPFPLSPFALTGGAAPHDYHHSHGGNTVSLFGPVHSGGGCYGIFQIWDSLLGSNAPFRAWVKKQE